MGCGYCGGRPPVGGHPQEQPSGASCSHFLQNERVAIVVDPRGASKRGADRSSYWPLALAVLFVHASKMTTVWKAAHWTATSRSPRISAAKPPAPVLADQHRKSTLQSFVTSLLHKAGRHSRRPHIEPQCRHQIMASCPVSPTASTIAFRLGGEGPGRRDRFGGQTLDLGTQLSTVEHLQPTSHFSADRHAADQTIKWASRPIYSSS
jgi:hypothetical protein